MTKKLDGRRLLAEVSRVRLLPTEDWVTYRINAHVKYRGFFDKVNNYLDDMYDLRIRKREASLKETCIAYGELLGVKVDDIDFSKCQRAFDKE